MRRRPARPSSSPLAGSSNNSITFEAKLSAPSPMSRCSPSRTSMPSQPSDVETIAFPSASPSSTFSRVPPPILTGTATTAAWRRYGRMSGTSPVTSTPGRVSLLRSSSDARPTRVSRASGWRSQDERPDLVDQVLGGVHVGSVGQDAVEDDGPRADVPGAGREVVDVHAVGHDAHRERRCVPAHDRKLAVGRDHAGVDPRPAPLLEPAQTRALDTAEEPSGRGPLARRRPPEDLVLDVVLVEHEPRPAREPERAQQAGLELDHVEPLTGAQLVDRVLHRR